MSLSMNEYDALLDRALSKITQSTGTGERFELPVAMVQIIGQRTIVVNFSDVVDRLNRDPHHVLKYLAKEMATAGSYESGRGYFQGGTVEIGSGVEVLRERGCRFDRGGCFDGWR